MTSQRNNGKDRKWFEPVFDFGSEKSAKKICIEPKTKPQKMRRTSESSKTVSNEKTLNVEDVLSNNWIDKFAPSNVSDLAVNVKKVEEVREWIKNSLSNSSIVNPILLLSGPSGSGKTVTVEIMVKAFGANLTEWVTPMDIECVRERDNISYSYYEKQSDKFSGFLLKASCYPSLLGNSNTPRIVLVEDFPNFLLRDSSEFGEILQKYRDRGKSPLIFICSENNNSSLNMVWSLFPPQTLEKFNIHHISFNPIAMTNMKAAMKRVTSLMSKKFVSLYSVPSQECIDGIINSSMGDIRSAINNLHFTSLKGSCAVQLKSETLKKNTKSLKTKHKKKGANSSKLKEMGKDENISVMHGVGRVLNPKFVDKIRFNDKETFVHSPICIAEQFQTQPSSFVGYIHENYLPHFSDIHNVELASNVLSDADCLLDEWKMKDGKLYGLTVAIAGVMLANKSPVSSWHPIRGQKNMKVPHPKLEEYPLLFQNQLIQGKILAADFKTYYDIIKVSTANDSDGDCIEDIDDDF